MSDYLTDGSHLYEIAFDRLVQNFGRLGGSLRVVVARDTLAQVDCAPQECHRCRRASSNEWRRLGDLELATLSPLVREAV